MQNSPARPRSSAETGLNPEALRSANLPHGPLAARAALGAVTLLAAVLRIGGLGAKSIWSDEAFSIFVAKLNWPSFWHLIATAEANMSLYYLFLRAWVHVGDAAWWVRLLSALMSIAVVPVVYSIGQEIFSQRTAIVAALLLAINPFDIRYAQEARGYSLFVLLVSVSFLAFFRYLKKPNRFWSVCYVLATALALYAHFFAAFAVLVQLISLTLVPASKRQAAIRAAFRLGIVIIVGLPLLWFVLFRDRGQLGWAPPVHGRDLYDVFRFMVGSGLKLGIAVAAFFIAASVWIRRCRNEGWTEEAWSFLVLALWLFLPVLLTLAISVWKPIYAPRFLIFCLPAALLLMAEGIAEIRFAWLRYALVLALIVGEIGPIRSYCAEAGEEDWKSAVHFLAANVQPGDAAVLPNPYCELPLKYAVEHAGVVVPEFKIISAPNLQGLQANGSDRIWMVTCSATKDANAKAALGEYRVAEQTRFKGVQIAMLER